MDDCNGRLDANAGVDRTATEQAARSAAHRPFDARPIRGVSACVNRPAGTLRETLRMTGKTKTLREFGGLRIRSGSATAHGRASRNIVASKRDDHTYEQALMSAAGGIAGAIRCRSQQF